MPDQIMLILISSMLLTKYDPTLVKALKTGALDTLSK
ncbi:MAG: hypothetical protein PWP74_1192 [Shewanella sp.]|nr:hypothetical protein [Shewanella sp.]